MLSDFKKKKFKKEKTLFIKIIIIPVAKKQGIENFHTVKKILTT